MPPNYGAENTPESPLDSKEIKPVKPKGNQPWILVGRTVAKTETPVFWASDAKDWFIGKVLDAGKDWRQKEKRMSEDKMPGWHHQCNDMHFSKLREMVRDREAWQYCSPWGCKEADTTVWLSSNNKWLMNHTLKSIGPEYLHFSFFFVDFVVVVCFFTVQVWVIRWLEYSFC